MEVFVQKTRDREEFVKKVFEKELGESIKKAKNILLKPNIVSSEPYPTTTHPETLRTCVEILLNLGKEVLVADGPAFDAGESQEVIDNHPLKEVYERFKLKLINLDKGPFKRVKTKSFVFNIASLAFEVDFIISLPVLKSHGTTGITGALKNQYGFLSLQDKPRLHRKNIHRAIAELNQIIGVDFWIVDAIETLIGTNEIRHGGKRRKLGYMLAGRDPVKLDTEGVKLLKEVDPNLIEKSPEDIPHLKWGIELGLGAF